MIAEQTIDQIRERANLADIIGESVKLTRKGRSLTGLCPFHKEKSPSFNVNEERGFYHCFGCKASGDVFKFVQETEGLTFLEAVRKLAERLGIELEEDLSGAERKRRAADKRREDGLYEVSRTAAAFFERCLKDHPDAHYALAELEKRGLPYDGPARSVLEAFSVGYAPHSWDSLAVHLRKAGHDLRSAESVGLVAPRKQGNGYYDRFRHRLMFSVLDLQGRVVAFSGRALPALEVGKDEPAKYINSPESPIYKKRATVFGLYQARSTLRSGKPCLVVEGNFDVLSLHAAGFDRAVAPLGTAFTPEQGRLIRRFTQNVTLLFDGDAAGKKATIASRDSVRQSGLNAKVARLPEGSDPDDFLRTRGPEGLQQLLGASTGMLDYLIEDVLDERFAAADAHERASRINKIIDLLKSEDDPNVRALAEQHADHLASRLGVNNARTFRALRTSIQKGLRAPEPEFSGRAPLAEDGDVGPVVGLGRSILGTLLDFPELLDSPLFLQNAEHLEGALAAAVACLRSSVRETPGPSAGAPEGSNRSAVLHRVLPRLPESVQEFARQRLAAPLHEEIESARVELSANLDKLRRMELTKMSSSTLGEMERARQEGNFEQELLLLRQLEQRARGKRGL